VAIGLFHSDLAESTADQLQMTHSFNGLGNQTKDGSDVELQLLQIKGRATFHINKEDEATLATKTATPIDKHQQSIQVVTEALIEDQSSAPDRLPILYRFNLWHSQNNRVERDLTWL